MSEPTESAQPAPQHSDEAPPRVHPEDPAEGPDPSQPQADEPRVHPEDPAEG